ncbi:putative mitochondrial protein [Andalucia godoyi]|uniref:Putative mitochondrial protein n=1 Tax=Andalucia godoyi TaxID=505711 RepID=A0A8K0AGV4_ANDGO|nr:putative mitochondrial protein [Andalucia godoyi]|eukprot:ANDGO_01578.mRNA.1 putative mitochondrial protein
MNGSNHASALSSRRSSVSSQSSMQKPFGSNSADSADFARQMLARADERDRAFRERKKDSLEKKLYLESRRTGSSRSSRLSMSPASPSRPESPRADQNHLDTNGNDACVIKTGSPNPFLNMRQKEAAASPAMRRVQDMERRQAEKRAANQEMEWRMAVQERLHQMSLERKRLIAKKVAVAEKLEEMRRVHEQRARTANDVESSDSDDSDWESSSVPLDNNDVQRSVRMDSTAQAKSVPNPQKTDLELASDARRRTRDMMHRILNQAGISRDSESKLLRSIQQHSAAPSSPLKAKSTMDEHGHVLQDHMPLTDAVSKLSLMDLDDVETSTIIASIEQDREAKLLEERKKNPVRDVVKDIHDDIIQSNREESVRREIEQLERERISLFEAQKAEIHRLRQESGLSVEIIESLLSLEPIDFTPEAHQLRNELATDRRTLLKQESLQKKAEDLERQKAEHQQSVNILEKKKASLKEKMERVKKETAICTSELDSSSKNLQENQAAQSVLSKEIEHLRHSKSHEATSSNAKSALLSDLESIEAQHSNLKREIVIAEDQRVEWGTRRDSELATQQSRLQTMRLEIVELQKKKGVLLSSREDIREELKGSQESLSKSQLLFDTTQATGLQEAVRLRRELWIRQNAVFPLSTFIEKHRAALISETPSCSSSSSAVSFSVLERQADHLLSEISDYRLNKTKIKTKKGDDILSANSEVEKARVTVGEFEKVIVSKLVDAKQMGCKLDMVARVFQDDCLELQ